MPKYKNPRAKYSKPQKRRNPVAVKDNGSGSKQRKNSRFIQRGKDMVDSHRKQKIIEDKYRAQTKSLLQEQFGEELGEPVDEDVADEENPFDELISSLHASNNNGVATDDEDTDDEMEESNPDISEDDDMVEAEEEEEHEDNLSSDDGEEEEDADLFDHRNEIITHDEDDIESPDDEEVEEDADLTSDDDEEEENLASDEEERAEDADTDVTAKDSAVYTSMSSTAVGTDVSDAEAAAEAAGVPNSNDIFNLHLDYELPPNHVESLLARDKNVKTMPQKWAAMENVYVELPIFEIEPGVQVLGDEDKITDPKIRPPVVTPVAAPVELEALGVKAALAANVPMPFSDLQTELFAVLNNYQDIFYPYRTFEHADELRQTYCLHALNHMLKTRGRIMHHNAKITAATKAPNNSFIMPDSYRDQGLVRPKVLIVVPVRDAAYRVMNTIGALMYGAKFEAAKKNGSLINYERFEREYTGDTIYFRKTNPKPVDYEQTFSGNTDDNFRIGIALTKKCVKIYTDFYASDIVIASPLGLRMLIGAPGSSDRNYDFLNSIELLIVDQAEMILAQNWENLLHIFDHLHLQPQSLRDTDFQRVRPWCLSGLSRFYRQTVLLATHELLEFRTLFRDKCSNYRGKVRVCNPVSVAEIHNVIMPFAQVFQRVTATSYESSFEQRFQHFVNEVLPRLRAPSYAHCMIYVPSYFDYVRLRNYFKAQTISFVQICEYTKDAKIARARDMFYHSGAHFLLYSERGHFFRRTRIKGIRHIVMYQPPMWPHFYAEMVNLMHNANQNANDGLANDMSVTVLYTKYDVLQLNGILGSATTMKLIRSGKPAHVFTNE